jgi:hypothetical protein
LDENVVAINAKANFIAGQLQDFQESQDEKLEIVMRLLTGHAVNHQTSSSSRVFEHSIPPELIAFDMLTPLGKGAQGMVWKSSINLQGTTQPIALKSLQLSGDTVTLDREIKSLKKLVHTNIVRFLGVTQNPIDRTGYLVLEYCPLGSMDVILKMFRDDAVVSRETLVTLLNGMK